MYLVILPEKVLLTQKFTVFPKRGLIFLDKPVYQANPDYTARPVETVAINTDLVEEIKELPGEIKEWYNIIGDYEQ